MSKYKRVIGIIVCILIAFVSGMLTERFIYKNDVSENDIRLPAMAVVSDILIKGINADDDILFVNIENTKNEQLEELMKQQVIQSEYEAKISADVVLNNGEQKSLITNLKEKELDFSKTETFVIECTSDGTITIEEIIENLQNLNITFAFDDTSNRYEYTTSYIE